jgi:hypothetical protein
MAPRVPAFGKAVAQHYERPFARFGEMEMDAVCLDCPMRDAADGLRIDRLGLANRCAGCRADPAMNSRRRIDDPPYWSTEGSECTIRLVQKSGFSAVGASMSRPA